MLSWLVNKTRLEGCLEVPPSKSHSVRAVIYAALADGESRLKGLLNSPDVEAAICACRALGARFVGDRVWGVAGRPRTPQTPIDAGNSGLVLRFMGALGALCEGTVWLTGDISIQRRRSVTPLIEGLNQLGASAEPGAPLVVRGRARAGRCLIDGADSQPVSALLTLASLLKGQTEIVVCEAKETPWIDVTLDWLRGLGVVIARHGYQTFKVQGRANWPAFTYRPPGDFSSAAFGVAAALVTQSSIKVRNLDFSDTQGDRRLFSFFGPSVVCKQDEIVITDGEFQGQAIDLDPFIDALPILAVLGCYARRKTRLFNAAGARGKESDRIKAMATELKKMGADIHERPDGLVIGPAQLRGARVNSHGDHRVAMALAVAGMAAEGETVVEDVACCAKTYPTFAKDMGLCVM